MLSKRIIWVLPWVNIQGFQVEIMTEKHVSNAVPAGKGVLPDVRLVYNVETLCEM